MKATTWKVTTALALALGLATPLAAQGNDRDRGGWDDVFTDGRVERAERDRDERDRRDRDDDGWYDRNGRRDDRRDDRRHEARRHDTRRQDRGNGPSFCRSGRGHPVFGWDWCRDRGWDRTDRRYPVRWERRTWDDVIFRRDDRKPSLDRRDLGGILGDVIFGRVDTRRRELGAGGDWLGRWVNTSSGRELWITAGGMPIARLVDLNGDRRVDAVYVAER